MVLCTRRTMRTTTSWRHAARMLRMALPRTFVGFSSTDIDSYRLMCAWKAHENIDFDFCDCQLQTAINSDKEAYIKTRCRERLQMAGTYVLLIGGDTFFQET